VDGSTKTPSAAFHLQVALGGVSTPTARRLHTRLCPPPSLLAFTTPSGGASTRNITTQMPPPPGSPATKHAEHGWAAGAAKIRRIDPNELKEGICKIYPSKDEKFAVCLEDEKIKIFPIEE